MNFIPPASFDDAPPVKYVPKAGKHADSISSPKIRKKKSLATLWHRKDAIEDPPPVPQIPKVFMSPSSCASPTSCADETARSFSVNETESLNQVDPTRSVTRDGLVISGVSFMDLSDSASEESQTPALLHKLRRALSKTDLAVSHDGSSPAPNSNRSAASLVPISPGVDSPGFRAHARRTNEAKGLRMSTYTNCSSVEMESLRSLGSWNSPLSSRTEHDLALTTPEKPHLDPDLEFNDFLTSNKSQAAPAPRTETLVLPSKPVKCAPPVNMPQNRKYETISVQATRESVHGYKSYLSQARPCGLPMPNTIEEDEGEWNRAVEWVRGQEADRVAQEMKAAKANGKELKSEPGLQALQQMDKIGLAKQFIRRTSTAWTPKKNSQEMSTDEATRDAIAEALHLAKEHDALDPGFFELRKRFFAGITNQFSKNGQCPESAPLPCCPEGSNTSVTARLSQYPSTPTRQPARSSTARVCQQTFPSRSVSAVGSSRFESQQSPSLCAESTTDDNAFEGLGIQLEAPDPESRDVALDGCGPFVCPVPVSPGESLRSQRNAFVSGNTSSSCSPQDSSQHLCISSSSLATSGTSVSATNGTDPLDDLQSTASETLANARIFKVDRDSKIQDRYVPKRCTNLYQTIDAARELAEARMGIASGTRSDPVFELAPAPNKKLQSASSQRNVFKRATKHPALRAMVSSMSMRSPDVTEMIPSPITSATNHPAFRPVQDVPISPTTIAQRQIMTQRFKFVSKAPQTSTSTGFDDPSSTPNSSAPSRSSSQKSSTSAVTAEDRWSQRVRRKANVERNWIEQGVLGADMQQTLSANTAAGMGKTQSDEVDTPDLCQPAVLETPTSPKSLGSDMEASPSLSRAVHQGVSPHLSRETQDSPTPLNIKKSHLSPKLQLELSLPDSPAPLHVPKLRSHLAVRRVLEQDLKNAPEMRKSPSSFRNDKDPFAKGYGTSSKGDEDWPLSDTRTSYNTALEDQRSFAQSPLDGHFDNIIRTWRHASATQEPQASDSSPSGFADVTRQYQYVRNYLELDQLREPVAGKAHPHHPYHWESTNVMCRGIHENARASRDTAAIEQVDDSVKFCCFCRETCYYFGQQVGRANLKTIGRDQTLEELKNKARSHLYYLRGTFPDGVEDYQVLMECALCNQVCCPGCGTICQYPLCSQPVCKQCVEFEDGICAQH